MPKQTLNDIAIGYDERDIVIGSSSALIEVCEIHTHGHLVEVLLLTHESDLTDGIEQTNYLVTAGRIGDSDMSNVSHIGNNYRYGFDLQCWCFDECDQQAALDHAWSIAREEAASIDSI